MESVVGVAESSVARELESANFILPGAAVRGLPTAFLVFGRRDFYHKGERSILVRLGWGRYSTQIQDWWFGKVKGA